jgi:hypothetical protein
VVLIKASGEAVIARRRETYEDLYAYDQW